MSAAPETKRAKLEEGDGSKQDQDVVVGFDEKKEEGQDATATVTEQQAGEGDAEAPAAPQKRGPPASLLSSRDRERAVGICLFRTATSVSLGEEEGASGDASASATEALPPIAEGLLLGGVLKARYTDFVVREVALPEKPPCSCGAGGAASAAPDADGEAIQCSCVPGTPVVARLPPGPVLFPFVSGESAGAPSEAVAADSRKRKLEDGTADDADARESDGDATMQPAPVPQGSTYENPGLALPAEEALFAMAEEERTVTLTLEEFLAEVRDVVGEADANSVEAFLSEWVARVEDAEKTTPGVELPLTSQLNDKAARTRIHLAAKRLRLPSGVAPDGLTFGPDRPVLDSGGLPDQRIVLKYCGPASSLTPPKPRGRNQTGDVWPKDVPNFLEFTLCKTNMDWNDAQFTLMKSLGLGMARGGGRQSVNRQAKAVGYAGMKDKRGVTSQRVTVFRIRASR
jgi:hypothetical protein